MARTPEHADVYLTLAGRHIYLNLCTARPHPSGNVLWNNDRFVGGLCVHKLVCEAKGEEIEAVLAGKMVNLYNGFRTDKG